MKKLATVLCIGISTLTFLSGCSSDTNNPKPNQSAEQTTTQKSAPISVGIKAGVGDTLERWIKEYGNPNRDTSITKSFKNDAYMVVIADNHVVNITLQNNNRVRKDSIIASMLPTDATQISSEDDISDPTLKKHKVKMHSDILSKAFAESKGEFTIIDVYNKNNGQYMHTIIDCTPSL